MEQKPSQKVMWTHVPLKESELINVNQMLDEGYEVSDIVPYMTSGGGAIYTNRSGLYTKSLLFLLTPSNKKTSLHYHHVSRDNHMEFVDKINEITMQENEKGWDLHKIIPGMAVVEPRDGVSLGMGTYVFCLFFIGT